MRIVLDTSALMSLAAGNILDLTTSSLECIVPERVHAEVLGLSKNNDFEGKLARTILEYIGKEIIIIRSYKSSQEGEIECAYLANELGDVEFIITDDTIAIEKIEKICKKKVRFSPMILYALCLKNKLNKKQAMDTLERMRVKRNWKDNIIFEQAKLLIQNIH